jgi:hypothetical protein
MCFDDASHLLSGMTGAAWLHIAPCAADLYAARLQSGDAGLSYSQVQQRLIANARVSASLYSSAQSSDEVLNSIDTCVKRLRGDGDLPQSIAATTARIDKLKGHLRQIDVNVLESDPLRIVIDARSLGENGASLRELYELAAGPAPEESQAAAPCVPAAYADNRYLVFLVAPRTPEQEIAQIFRIASRIQHAKQTGKDITWYLLTGNPEPEKPENTEEENLDDFTDISELEAFEAENDEKTADEFDVDDADDNASGADTDAEGSNAGDADISAGSDTADGVGSDASSRNASNLLDSNPASDIVIEDVAAEIAFPAPDMSDPGEFMLHQPEKICTAREALLAEHTRIAIDEAIGKICAVPVSCHPAWTIIAPGERIDENTVAIMKSYGIGYAEVSSPIL